MKSLSRQEIRFYGLIAILGAATGWYLAEPSSGDTTESLGGKEVPRRIPTRIVPMMAANLKPGMVVTIHDLAQGPWPANEIVGDVLLGPQSIIGRVVKKEIKAATPIHASSLYRTGEYSKEYIGVP